MSSCSTVRPYVTPDHVNKILRDKYGLTLTTSGIVELESFEDRNFKVTATSGEVFIMKITNSYESSVPGKIQAQTRLTRVLKDKGLKCSQHLPDKNGQLYSTCEFASGDGGGSKNGCAVRLLTYLPGSTLSSFKQMYQPSVYHATGVLLAKLHTALQDFLHDDLTLDPENGWIAENAMIILNYMSCIKDPELDTTVRHAITNVQAGLEKYCGSLQKGVVHGDFHDSNLIVDEVVHDIRNIEPSAITNAIGIIDFNEVCYTYRVFEIGRLISDLMTSSPESDGVRLELGGHVLAGYISERSVSSEELMMMYDAVCISFVQYIVLGEHAYSQQPNNPYTKIGSDEASRMLKLCHRVGKTEVLAKLASVLSQYNVTISEWLS